MGNLAVDVPNVYFHFTEFSSQPCFPAHVAALVCFVVASTILYLLKSACVPNATTCLCVGVCLLRSTGPPARISASLHLFFILQSSQAFWSNSCMRKLFVTPWDKYNHKDGEIKSQQRACIIDYSPRVLPLTHAFGNGVGGGFRLNRTNKSAICCQLNVHPFVNVMCSGIASSVADGLSVLASIHIKDFRSFFWHWFKKPVSAAVCH